MKAFPILLATFLFLITDLSNIFLQMATHPDILARSRYINIEALEVTRDAQDPSSLTLKRFPTPTSASVKTLGCITYIVFFIWQLVGLILYSIRAFETSLVARHATFQSTDIKIFLHSEELELAWVVSQICNTALVIMALSKVPSFLGYTAILKMLARLPSFWSLLSLYVMCIVGYLLIIALKNDSGMEITLILAFMIEEGVQVTLLGFLNFTRVDHSRGKCIGPCKLFAFFKLNIFLLFLVYFVEFVIGTLQFALHIYGIDDVHGIPSDFMSLIGAIRRFTVVIFSYRVYIFHWEKLLIDNRNILCHYDYLDQFTANAPQSYTSFTSANPA